VHFKDARSLNGPEPIFDTAPRPADETSPSLEFGPCKPNPARDEASGVGNW